MRNLMIFAPLLALFACGGADPAQACEDYLAAVETCYADATVEMGDMSAACAGQDELTGDAASASADIFNCYADAYSAGDCTTAEGITAVSDEMTACATAAL